MRTLGDRGQKILRSWDFAAPALERPTHPEPQVFPATDASVSCEMCRAAADDENPSTGWFDAHGDDGLVWWCPDCTAAYRSITVTDRYAAGCSGYAAGMRSLGNVR